MLLASGVFSTEAFTALVAGAILAGVPLMFGALGELVSERAGVLNIGLEGMMLMGAYAGFVAAYYGNDEWAGFGAGMAAGAAVSLVMVFFCVRLGLDQIVTGIAITLACEGATALIFNAEFAESRPTLGAVSRVSIPGLASVPVVGGRGFIAIVLAMLARGRPLWSAIGAFLFGISLSIADWAQVANINISTDLVFMLPFILVLLVLVLFGRRSYLPAALALPYVRGAR